ncbi:MAG: DUF262 domain-containing HNH endonuclease family protein [Defluviitaleaceae bacterium]|nr:DUF262 domain-containing HNH endonuclease family protein [Defluviitaleaceae bacterium]
MSSGTHSHSKNVIIDGQQRLTTISILLITIGKITKNETILKKYIVNRDWNIDNYNYIKLKPIERDYQIYREIINDTDVSFKSSNIYLNYNYFFNQIKTKEYADKIFKALEYLEIVYIELNEDENVQLIFESLNSTGLGLSQVDLVRNFLLMGNSYEIQKRFYKDYWFTIENKVGLNNVERFIRDFIILKSNELPKDTNVYECFKKYYSSNYKDKEAIFKDLLSYSEIYSYLLNSNSGNDKINTMLAEIKNLGVLSVYPVLLSLMFKYFELKIIIEDNVLKTLEVILSYILRRKILSLPSNAVNKVSYTLARKIDDNEVVDTYRLISEYLLNYSESGKFPTDVELKEYLINKELKSSVPIKYILSKIEKNITREVVNFDETQIEHIMPQNIKNMPEWQIELGKNQKDVHENYLNNIGNLTLTMYNQKLSNKPFSDKKNDYTQSNIRITRDLTNYENWNEGSIKKRSEYLTQKIIDIFIFPHEFIEKDETRVNTEYNIMDDTNPTSSKPTSSKPTKIIFENKEIKVSTWREFFKKFCFELYNQDTEYFKNINQSFISLEFKDNTPSSRWVKIDKDVDIYINTYGSAFQLLSYCKILAREYGIQDDISYFIYRS